MSFPTSPANGQTAFVNNVLYTWNSVQNTWTGAGASAGYSTATKFTTSATAPTSPVVGDRWYKTTTDVIYEYVTDGGGSSYWIDIYTQQTSVNNRKFTVSNSAPTSPSIGDEWYLASADVILQYIADGSGNTFWMDTSTRTYNSSTASFANVYTNAVYANSYLYANGTSYSSGGGSVANINSYSNGNISVTSTNTTFTGNVTVSTLLNLPYGTLASRPNTGVQTGALRINTDTSYMEVYYNNYWSPFALIGNSIITATTTNANLSTSGTYTVATFKTSGYFNITSSTGAPSLEVLIVGGGGGGGGVIGGGGGAGGVLYSASLTPVNGNIAVIVGGGQPGGIGYPGGAAEAGTTGSNSSILFNSVTYIAAGGGGGGSNGASSKSGGSGGGGGYTGGGVSGSATQTNQSTFTGYGNAGGAGSDPLAGGGGGAGAAGAAYGSGGAGGIGASFNITGTATYYAGGGGTGARTGSTGGAGGLGGGGTGISTSTYVSATQDGNVNTGGGGGGGGFNGYTGAQVGGNGGSGVVIIRYRTS